MKVFLRSTTVVLVRDHKKGLGTFHAYLSITKSATFCIVLAGSKVLGAATGLYRVASIQAIKTNNKAPVLKVLT